MNYQTMMDEFTKITLALEDNYVERVCMLGRSIANFLNANDTQDAGYIAEKKLLIQSHLVQFLHEFPVDGITLTDEAIRDNIPFGESWYKGRTANNRLQRDQKARGKINA
jgi:hypothetical protein